MRIALYGIGGLYNYGCEAIVRGTVELIRHAAPDSEITYYSRRAEEDREKIEDLNIEVTQLKSNFFLLAKVVNRIFGIMNIPYRVGDQAKKQIVEATDVIFSIGGDIYTIPEHVRKKQKYPYYKKIVQFGEYALKKNKRLVIYGASIGPFGEHIKAKKYFFDHLKKVNLIVAREQKCIEYLAQNEIEKNVCFMPDPAYAVLFESETEIIPKYIGINLSPLSIKELYGTVSNESIKKMTKQIENIVSTVKLEVLLIPHVISPVSEADNDLLFMERIYKYLNKETREKVRLCNPKGFLDAKRFLRSCRVVISARMHCAINAVCEGVPTLFLSYSEKAKGMCHFVYENDKFLIQLQDLDSEILNRVTYILKREDEIREYLTDRITQIRRLMFQEECVGRIREIINDNRR